MRADHAAALDQWFDGPHRALHAVGEQMGGDEVYRVEIPIDVVDRTEPGFTRARAKVSGFEKTLMQTEKRLKSIGRGMTSAGRAATRWLTGPIIAAGAASVMLYSKFSSSMTKIRALVGASNRQVKKWSDDLIDLSRRIGRTPQELAEGLYFVASSGFEGAAALKILKISAKGAAAGLGETNIVADATTSAISAYGKETLSAKEAVDVLLSTVKLGKGEPTELAAAIGRVIAPAEAAGVSFRELGASIASYSLVLPNVHENVTGIRQLLLTFAKPTNDTKQALHDLGLTTKDVNDMMREDFWKTLLMLREGLDDIGTNPAKIFGNVRALNAFMALTGRRAEENTKIFDEMNDKLMDTDSALRKVERQDPMFKFNRAMANLQATLIEVAPKIMPTVEKILHVLEGWAKAIGRMDEDKLERLLKLLAGAAIAGPLLRAGGGLMSILGGAVGMYRGAKYGPKGTVPTVPTTNAPVGKMRGVLGALGRGARKIPLVGALAAMAGGASYKFMQDKINDPEWSGRSEAAGNIIGDGKHSVERWAKRALAGADVGRMIGKKLAKAVREGADEEVAYWKELREMLLRRDADEDRKGSTLVDYTNRAIDDQIRKLRFLGGDLTATEWKQIDIARSAKEWKTAQDILNKALRRTQEEMEPSKWDRMLEGYKGLQSETKNARREADELKSVLDSLNGKTISTRIDLIATFGSLEAAARSIDDYNERVDAGLGQSPVTPGYTGGSGNGGKGGQGDSGGGGSRRGRQTRSTSSPRGGARQVQVQANVSVGTVLDDETLRKIAPVIGDEIAVNVERVLNNTV